ncbi:2Fe-2S iron-sulfur cluster-binding protein [Streptomyces sp. NPDC052051]|uniref:2Fe-2S iron-sulfur cluster-binding protein n=1 Tax=Streptomyces sp. NPDC052051 TaxID=3154649 RepID=UPI0034493EF0
MTDDQHREDAAHESARGSWERLPQGEYDDGATAFVQLPEGGVDALLASYSPLAAPGHGFVPPAFPPAADTAGAWDQAAGNVHWPDANAATGQGGDDRFTYDPAATAQWTMADAAPAQPEQPVAGHDVTGQWSIPVADGELSDDSGEFNTSSLVEQWGHTPPATLPGGAAAPWVTEPAEPAGQPGQPWTDPAGESAAQAPVELPEEPSYEDALAGGAPQEPAAVPQPSEPAAPVAAGQLPEPAAPVAAEETPDPAPDAVPVADPVPAAPDPVPVPAADPAPEAEADAEADASESTSEQASAPAPEAAPEQPAAEPTPEPAPEPALELALDDHPLASYVLRVNGADRPVSDAWIGESLLYVLRERLGLAGAKDGCSQGECGACNVQVDGRLVASCLVPAVTAASSEVRTVEGLAVDGHPSDVQRALAECGAVQCGFCIPGMAMTVHDLLEGNPAPTERETRQALCGNLCRCSGYRGVLDAVAQVAAGRRAHTEHTETEPGQHAEAAPSVFDDAALNEHPYGQDGGQA